jgi:hypothetical protein
VKLPILILALLASGCSTTEFVCRGAGTCYTDLKGQTVMANGQHTDASARYVPVGAQQVTLPTGGYLIVRSQTTGAITSVIQTSKSK